MRRSIVAVALILVLTVTSTMVFAQAGQTRKAPERAKDPVCGIPVDKDPKLSANYKGETYYFCSKADMDKFKQEPERYAKKK